MNYKKLGIKFLEILGGTLLLMLINHFFFKNPLFGYNYILVAVLLSASDFWYNSVKSGRILKKPHTLIKRMIINLINAVLLILIVDFMLLREFYPTHNDISL